MKKTTYNVGTACKIYRMQILKQTQKQVAVSIGCSAENIAAFENGRNNNLNILVWYMDSGMSYEFIRKYGSIEEYETG